MRASFLQSNLDALDSLGAETARVVRAAIPDTVAQIEGAVRTKWLPLECALQLTNSLAGIVGREGVRRWSQDAVLEATRGPLLGPLLRGLQAVGLNPVRALRRAPSAYLLVYRDFGVLEFEAHDATRGVITHSGVPSAYLGHEAYFEGFAGAWEGVITLTGGGRRPRAEVEIDRAGNRIVYACSWTPD